MQGERERRGSATLASWSWWLELLIVTALFAAAGAWPTPDTNEAHYLTRARHAVDPTWAAGDFFLDSPEAHGLFTLVIGPLAAAVPLGSAAWIGRLAGWTLLAAGFVHVARAALSTTESRLLAAALFSLALRHTTAAGEWMIGGCEAKVFAWAGVLWAAGEIVRGRWGRAWVMLGAATAVHPLVGGWAMIATGIEWGVLERRGRVPWAAVGCGIVLALIGIWPALQLSSGADAAVRAEAARIYVTERLPHHLLPRTFADGMIARHLLAALASWLMVRQLTKTTEHRRLHGFALAALAIAIVGFALSCCEPIAPDLTYGLLKFYWFRLTDGLTPLALAVTAAAFLAEGSVVHRVFGSAALARWAVVIVVCLDLAHESRHWPLPFRAELPARSDRFVHPAAWRDVCGWVRDNAPADARFVVPRMAGSFVWRTGRPEVVCWKNIPQGPQAIVEWRQRIIDCYSRDGSLTALDHHASSLGREHLLAVARRYGADHAIVPVDAPGLDGQGLTPLHANERYAVVRLHP